LIKRGEAQLISIDDTAPSLKIILQEPQFTPLDIEYLQSFPNYEVVSDPDAFGRITTGTLVYAVHCYSQVYKAVGEGARPAVIVGTDMGNFGRFNTYVFCWFSKMELTRLDLRMRRIRKSL
jgi:hypothetical protein